MTRMTDKRQVNIRLTVEQRELFQAAAARAGKPLATWVHDVAMAAAPDQDPLDELEAIFDEIERGYHLRAGS